MYEVELSAGEIRAIISYYDNAIHYLEDVADSYDSYRENVVAESIEESKTHIKARVNYLMTKLDMGH